MMAFEGTPSVPTLGPRTIELLRASLAKSAQRGSHADDLRDVLCTAASEARAKGIQPEALLVLLKDIWHSLPDVLSAPSSQAEQALLQQVISRCIQEYYST
jgi:hypothetical protein